MVDFNLLVEALQQLIDTSDHSIGSGLFRVAYGVLILAFCLGYLFLSDALIGGNSILSRADFLNHRLRPKGLFDLSGDHVALAISSLILITAGVLLIGTSVPGTYLFPFIWVAFCSLQSRNPFFNYGGDDVVRLLSFALIPGVTETSASGVLLAQAVMICVYWNTASYKIIQSEWRSGVAVSGFLRLTMISRFRFSKTATQAWLYKPLTYAALVMEFLIPACLFFEQLVPIGVALAIGLHLAIHILYRLHFFQLTMITGLLLFPTNEQYQSVAQFVRNVAYGVIGSP